MLRWLWRLLSPYAHPQERKIAKFVHSLRDSTAQQKVHKKLAKVIQEDLVVINLWLETTFKGYKHYRKGKRRKLYQNSALIKDSFLQYCNHNPVSNEDLLRQVRKFNIEFSQLQIEHLSYLLQIMQFLKPGLHYKYRKASSFAKLLVNLPEGETMIGDCNQIVTFYLYLFSQKYPITDLELKLVPGHVCLHYNGIDIEATNGTFKKYEEHSGVVPSTELIAINLLDVADAQETQAKISPRTILRGARLAERLSSNKELVQHNLQVAYHNLALVLQQRGKYDRALTFAKKANKPDLVKSIYNAATRGMLKKKKFSKALFYAQKAKDPELATFVQNQQAKDLLDRDQWTKARRIFKQTGNKKGVRATYAQEFNALRQRVRNVKTKADQKRYKSVYRKMLAVAKQLDDQKLVNQLQSIIKKI